MGPLVLDEIAASGATTPMTDARRPAARPGPGASHGRASSSARRRSPPGAGPAAGGRNPWRTRFFALAGGRGRRRGRRGCCSATGCSSCGRSRSPAPISSRPRRCIAGADVPLGTPLSRVDAGAVTRRVEAIRQVASATVSVDWPDHVAIAVTERVPVMAVRMAHGGYDLVDPAGVVVRWRRPSPPGCRCSSPRCRAPRCARTPASPPPRPCWPSWRPRWSATVSSVSVAAGADRVGRRLGRANPSR